MDAAETILRYIAVPTLSAALAGLIGLLIWVLRTQSALQGTVLQLKGSVDELGLDIRDLTGTMRQEREERNHLASRVGTHDVRLENLDGRLKVVERHTARHQPEEEL